MRLSDQSTVKLEAAESALDAKQSEKLVPNIKPHRKIIGTFHKSGSVLWQMICEQATKEGVFRHSRITEERVNPDAEVILSLHADETSKRLEKHGLPLQGDERWVICIRDPRDVLISAANYHSTTNEAWCHKPTKAFGGLTYHEKINSYSSLHDKVLFEMDNSGGRAVRAMIAMKKELSADAAHFTKLEELMQDTVLKAFRECFAFLRFDPGRIVDLLAIAVERSFFSDPGALERSRHARAAKVAEFRDHFNAGLHAQFEAQFPRSLNILGYPEDGISVLQPNYFEPKLDECDRMWPRRRPTKDTK